MSAKPRVGEVWLARIRVGEPPEPVTLVWVSTDGRVYEYRKGRRGEKVPIAASLLVSKATDKED